RFDGLNNGPSYWGVFRGTYKGILTGPEDRLWGGDVSPVLVKELHRLPVGVLHADVTPGTARNNATVSLVFLGLVGWFTFHCVMKQGRQMRARSDCDGKFIAGPS